MTNRTGELISKGGAAFLGKPIVTVTWPEVTEQAMNEAPSGIDGNDPCPKSAHKKGRAFPKVPI